MHKRSWKASEYGSGKREFEWHMSCAYPVCASFTETVASLRSNGTLSQFSVSALRRTPNKSVKPFACGSLGHSVLRTRSAMASPLLPEQALRTECRLPRRYVQ